LISLTDEKPLRLLPHSTTQDDHAQVHQKPSELAKDSFQERNHSMSSPQLLIENALALLRSGGKAAERGAEMLFRHFYPRFVRRFVLGGQSEAEAAEIANEAMMNVIRGLSGVESPGAMHSWIWTVARNALLSRVRSTNSEKQHEISVDNDDGESLLETFAADETCDPLTRLCLEKQLDRFEREHPKRVICLEMAILDGMALPEIASAIARSYEATKEYLSQCRKQLWAFLKPCFE
jgi:RNA polymerase sigma factor (sigma-70 family)